LDTGAICTRLSKSPARAHRRGSRTICAAVQTPTPNLLHLARRRGRTSLRSQLRMCRSTPKVPGGPLHASVMAPCTGSRMRAPLKRGYCAPTQPKCRRPPVPPNKCLTAQSRSGRRSSERADRTLPSFNTGAARNVREASVSNGAVHLRRAERGSLSAGRVNAALRASDAHLALA